MLVFLITDENFDQVESRQKATKMGIVTKLHKSKNTIKISVNTMAPFAIYKWAQDGHFAISNKLDKIAEYIEPLGYELTFTPTDSKYVRIKPRVDKARDCSNVEKITCWNTIVVDRNGTLKITPPPRKQPYSVPLTTKHGVRLLLRWLKKYLVLATKEIESNRFIPTLTGGLDTRTLTWFWRDLYQGTDYYLKAVKPDGKNNISKGQAEIEIATLVLNYLGKSLGREEKCNQLTFSGIFTENGRGLRNTLNDADFIYDYIAFHFSYGGEKYFGDKFVCPFVDDLYLQLSHPEKDYMRILLAILLCPDLLDITLYGYGNKPPYQFNEEFTDLIPKVEEFIQEYDLRKRVAKIKAKVLSSR